VQVLHVAQYCASSMKRLSMLRRICASSVMRTISDATQQLMRLNWFDDALDVRAVACVRVGRVLLSRRATTARSAARAQKSARAASSILPRDLNRVVVEQRAALWIELVAAVLEHFLGRRLVRRSLAVKLAAQSRPATRGTRPRASRQTSVRCHPNERSSSRAPTS
jgi:hypothetical protein